MPTAKTKIVLFLGAGFSTQSGFPNTATLSKKLLEAPASSRDPGVEAFISDTIMKFWENVFAWKQGMTPSLEDHFTQIDVAAKSYHNLGPDYDSRRLWAIRQMTIHRIWGHITRPPGQPFPDDHVVDLMNELIRVFEVTVVTTNWDTHVEWILDAQCTPFNYGVEEVATDGTPVERQGNVSLLKLHGCMNTAYCDCCQLITRLNYGREQAVVDLSLLLDPDDFQLLGADAALVRLLRRNAGRLGACGVCHSRLGTRVATFTHRKDIQGYHAVWDAARTSLQLASRWLFIGYSMPEADVEVRHLLKSTQLARRGRTKLQIDVVLKEDCTAVTRYQRFFGLPSGKVFQDGLERWLATHLRDYCV